MLFKRFWVFHSFTFMGVDATCTLDDRQMVVGGSHDLMLMGTVIWSKPWEPSQIQTQWLRFPNPCQLWTFCSTSTFGRWDLIRALEFKAHHGKHGRNSVVQQCYIPMNHVPNFNAFMQYRKKWHNVLSRDKGKPQATRSCQWRSMDCYGFCTVSSPSLSQAINFSFYIIVIFSHILCLYICGIANMVMRIIPTKLKKLIFFAQNLEKKFPLQNHYTNQ